MSRAVALGVCVPFGNVLVFRGAVKRSWYPPLEGISVAIPPTIVTGEG